MINEIILAIIVVGLFLGVLTTLLVLTIKRVNILTKKNFVEKLQQYDFLIDEKEQLLERVEDEIIRYEIKKGELERAIEKMKHQEVVQEIVPQETILPKVIDLDDGTFLDDYRMLKRKFNLNPVKVLSEFVLQNPVDENLSRHYERLERVKELLDFQNVYKIMTFMPDDQKKIVSELVDLDSLDAISPYLEMNKFSVEKMLSNINQELSESDPNIYAYVSEDSSIDELSKIDQRIVLARSDNVSEGVKIMYRGVSYDYSI